MADTNNTPEGFSSYPINEQSGYTLLITGTQKGVSSQEQPCAGDMEDPMIVIIPNTIIIKSLVFISIIAPVDKLIGYYTG